MRSPGIPTREQILALTTEELAYVMLTAFQQRDQLLGMPSRGTSSMEIFKTHTMQNFGMEDTRLPEKPLRDAWKKLEEWEFVEPAEGINGKNGYMELTNKGKACTERVDFEKIRVRSLLTREMLHPLLWGKTFEDYSAGHFSDAILNAFKTVEVAIREAASLAESDFGVALIRKAFAKGAALFDASELETKNKRLEEFFTGAFGLFRNSNAHSVPVFDDPRQAMEELMIASRLLRYVDERKPTATT